MLKAWWTLLFRDRPSLRLLVHNSRHGAVALLHGWKMVRARRVAWGVMGSIRRMVVVGRMSGGFLQSSRLLCSARLISSALVLDSSRL